MTQLLTNLVDHAAVLQGGKAAFVSNSQCLSYSELASQSNQLAHLLIDFDVKPGDRVGVMIGRKVESATAIFGIMKAGGIYVPLDPNAAPAVNAQIVSDCNLRVIVTHQSKAKALSRLLEATALVECVIGTAQQPAACKKVANWQDLTEYPKTNPPNVEVFETDPAYILYTSGTTGKPKGIVHTHLSGLSYARLTVTEYDLQASDRIGCHSPLHFDMSTFGFFAGPMACATTVIVSEADTKFPASISAIIQDEQISVWYSVPIVLTQLLSRGVLDERSVEFLRWVVYAGEPLSVQDLEALRNTWPHVEFSNAYGPTETNVCTVFNIPALNSTDESLQPETATSVPIGKPWGQVKSIVIASDGTLAPAGQSGELLIQSPALMQGYWQRPELNEKAFYTLPDSETAYYRTGDLVRQDDHGNYSFEGRIDRQVKIRGFRIELDGVERVLNSHPDVDESCVIVESIDQNKQSLAAYVVLRPGTDSDQRTLLQFSKSQLPAYSVPDTFHFTRHFARTSTGKLDRTKLSNALNS